jgi:outer membrane protein assembly factor BamE (lipoprotein component of BamABCDE complex)
LFILAVAAVAGCASTGAELAPGKSTAADVEREMGRPAERISFAGGDSVWYYPRGMAQKTYAVRVGANGVVSDVSQVLTQENLARLEPGKSTTADVKAILGPPFRITPMARIQRDVWEYYMLLDTRARITYVQFDQSGRVREVLQIDDPFYESRGNGNPT